MKVFVSSLMSGFESYRQAAFSAVNALGYELISAESFPSQANSSRIACLEGVRAADIVVLILGEKYGYTDTASNLSPTHEEYREAKDQGKVIAFIQSGVARETRQQEFVNEVQDWDNGLFRGKGFSTPEELQDQVTQALHRHAMAQQTRPIDPAQLVERAKAIIPPIERHQHRSYPILHLALAGGPIQQIVRPQKLDDRRFGRGLINILTDESSDILDIAAGTETRHDDGALVLQQETGAAVRIDEAASITISVPVQIVHGFMSALIEEYVADALDKALKAADLLLDHVDPTKKIARIVPAIRLDTNGTAEWRTKAENDASPNSFNLMQDDPTKEWPILLNPSDRPRAALRATRQVMSEDMLTLLRRRFKH